MNGYVITILGNTKSQNAANRCIASAKKFGINTYQFWATTPLNQPLKQLIELGIPTEGFIEKYSRPDNCMAAFLSHYKLWMHCVNSNSTMIIFEHDAVVVDTLPVTANFDKVMNIGKPSYGKFNMGKHLGPGPLFSKPYFPGAHAYMIKPEGAKELIEGAKSFAAPTDVFLHVKNFPWLQEYNPWPVEARDSFTTIQKPEGCLAKHNYNAEYEIV